MMKQGRRIAGAVLRRGRLIEPHSVDSKNDLVYKLRIAIPRRAVSKKPDTQIGLIYATPKFPVAYSKKPQLDIIIGSGESDIFNSSVKTTFEDVGLLGAFSACWIHDPINSLVLRERNCNAESWQNYQKNFNEKLSTIYRAIYGE
jgi:hypothetical protein